MCKFRFLCVLVPLLVHAHARAESCETLVAIIEPVRAKDIGATALLAERIFALDHEEARDLLRTSLLGGTKLQLVSLLRFGLPLARLDFYRLPDFDGRGLGLVALHAFRDRRDAWVSFLGVDEVARRGGAGGALLEFAIGRARREGFETLRLWSSNAPEYAAANQLFRDRGFTAQPLEIAEPNSPEIHYDVYSLSLTGESAPAFTGSPREALLGTNARDIARGRAAYRAGHSRP